MTWTVHEADVLDALRAMPDNSFHGCLTDPPYGLSFMGHGWDHGVPSAEVWREVLRVMKPGAYLLAFGGTRTFHRLTCAIEDAGFEVRDVIAWMYGSGFPKSHDVSKAIDREAGAVRTVTPTIPMRAGSDVAAISPNVRCALCLLPRASANPCKCARDSGPATEAARQWAGYGTALKPAYEPILVARRPLEGTVAANVQTHGCGGLAIDACRVGTAKRSPEFRATLGKVEGSGSLSGVKTPRANVDASVGRWPANVILDEEAGAALDAQSGELRNGGQNATSRAHSPRGASGLGSLAKGTARAGDSGGASRFFQSCNFSPGEVVFSRAMAIIDGCSFDHASIANAHSPQSRRAADSALSDAVILVSQGATRLAGWSGLSTSATPSESRLLSATLIAAILSITPRFSLGSPLESVFPSGSRASVAAGQGPTGTMRITVSHWRSDGSAEPVTFNITRANSGHGEAGSASRFIYCAKASRAERDAGLEAFDLQRAQKLNSGGIAARREAAGLGQGRNIHPTVKPLALARYLARLILPPVEGTRLLTPFCGSGSEMIGALQAGWSHVEGIDSWDVAVRIARARLAHHAAQLPKQLTLGGAA